MLASACWGAIAGLFKARFGVHEVISTIMLNWIAFYLNNYFVMLESFKRPNSETSQFIQDSGSIVFFENFKLSEKGQEFFLQHPTLQNFLKPPVNAGILISLLLIVLVWLILKKTTLGYSLRAVGLNKYGAEYGGINVKKNIVVSMAIAGALAGTAGALHVMAISKNISILAIMEGYGFDGIAVALIGNNSPLGCLLSGMLFGALKYSGPKIQSALGAPSEVINIVIGTIVFFVAIPGFALTIFSLFKSRKKTGVLQ
jgi:simple sugar transport system permease protein